MVEFARPALAAAGLAAALVPLLLHLIARRPRERVALPTARFLAPDARVSVRLRRRPTDLPLLALRMLLLLLLGAGLAGPVWHPDRGGTVDVVLLDRGRGMREGDAWWRAVDEARRRLVGADGRVRGDLVLFDSSAVHVPGRMLTEAWFDSLAATPPADVSPDYAVALRALAAAGREMRGADSARATLLTVPRWDGWRPGMVAVRRATWPGSLDVPRLAPTDTVRAGGAPPPGGDAASPGDALLVAGADEGVYVAAALEATGWRVLRTSPDASSADLASSSEPSADAARLVVVLSSPSRDVARAIGEQVGAGSTLLASADAASLDSLLPWRRDGAGEAPGGTIRLGGNLRLEGAAGRVTGGPAAGARVLAAWDDGRPAAASASVGRGCAVAVAAPLEGGRLPLSADYPRALDRLARDCASVWAGDGTTSIDGRLPLDSGALAVLRLADRPRVVAASAVAGPGGGVPLGRWVLAAALLVALAETALAYGRRGGSGAHPTL